MPVVAELRARWMASAEGRLLLALLAALARDSLLRASVPLMIAVKPGSLVTCEDFCTAIQQARGDRFSDETITAVVSHLYTSWTESGHLKGERERTRGRVNATVASTGYALALGYLTGARGELLFSTLWAAVLDAPAAVLHEHAREASRFGWLNYRGIGNFVEIMFPILSAQRELVPHHGGENDRFRDAVDLLLRDLVDDADLHAVRVAFENTFRVRAEHSWPPAIALPPSWREPYAAMARALGIEETELGAAELALRAFLSTIKAA